MSKYLIRLFITCICTFVLIGTIYIVYSKYNTTYLMSSISMEPAINKGQKYKIAKYIYENSTPKRFDVVVFYNEPRKEYYCARILGLPGENIFLTGKTLIINGEVCEFPDYLNYVSYTPAPSNKNETTHTYSHRLSDYYYNIPVDSYYVVVDRPHTLDYDSRIIGAISKELIVGKVILEPILSIPPPVYPTPGGIKEGSYTSESTQVNGNQGEPILTPGNNQSRSE